MPDELNFYSLFTAGIQLGLAGFKEDLEEKKLAPTAETN